MRPLTKQALTVLTLLTAMGTAVSVSQGQQATRVIPTVSRIPIAERPNLWLKHQNVTSVAFRNFREDNFGRDQIKALRIGFTNPPHDRSLSLPTQLEPTIGNDIGLRLNKRQEHHILVESTRATRKVKDYTIEMLINPAWENNWQGLASKATNGENYSIMLALMPVSNERSYRLAFYTSRNNWTIAAGGRRGTPEYDSFVVPAGQLSHVAASFGNCFMTAGQYEVCNIALYINGRMRVYGTMQPGAENEGLLRIGSWYGPRGSVTPAYLNTDPPVPFQDVLGDSTASANPEYNFSGIISETMFWDRVLVPELIQAHADVMRQGREPQFR